MPPSSDPYEIFSSFDVASLQKDLVYIDIILLLANNGALLEDLKSIMVGIGILTEDNPAERSHQLLFIFGF